MQNSKYSMLFSTRLEAHMSGILLWEGKVGIASEGSDCNVIKSQRCVFLVVVHNRNVCY